MTTVIYIVWERDFSNDTILGAYSNKEDAKKFKEEYLKDNKFSDVDIDPINLYDTYLTKQDAL